MIVTITSLRLRSLSGFFRLSYTGLGIVRQTRSQPGFIKMKNTGFGYLHYTMSCWESAQAAKAFAHSGAHQAAMRIGGQLATEIRVYTFEGDTFPAWGEAKRLVAEKGRVFAY